MARQGVEETTPTEALLQNLLKRPDVRSTLILSREDGSIIKAAGLITRDLEKSSPEHLRTSVNVAEEGTGNQDQGADNNTETQPKDDVSCAQILASSIFHFVASATALSASLKRVDTVGSVAVSMSDQNKKEEADDKDSTTEDVQLLRLRLRKQEIIVFPDPRYLCCVIQDIDKSSR